MILSDQTLAALVLYGLPVLFTTVLVAAMGLPLPSSLMLLVAGSLVQVGEMSFWAVAGLAASAAVFGDNLGYLLGWRGGRPLALRLSRRLKQESKMAGAEQFMCRWGGPGIFFSRWLLTPLGPWLNLAGGMTLYSWWRFLVWDVAGETLWVLLYIGMGMIVGEQLGLMVDTLGDLTWLVMALFATAVIGRQLYRQARQNNRGNNSG
jgi:membrane-associated protein